jgi:CHAT domain-containing protein/tetratricopeptide (TPR) repeat protein
MYRESDEDAKRGEFGRSTKTLEQILAVVGSAYGTNDPEFGFCLDRLATAYQTSGKYEQALSLQQRSLTIFENYYGTNDPRVCLNLNGLALTLLYLGNHESALPLLERSLNLAEKSYGAEHPETASQLEFLALACEARNDYKTAADLLNRSLKIREAVFGRQSPEVAASLDLMARVLQATGACGKALLLVQRSLAIRESVFGLTDERIVPSLYGIASAYECLGDFDRAIQYRQLSLNVSENLWGKEHSKILLCLEGLASAHLAKGDLDKAELLFQRALIISEKSFGNGHARTASIQGNLASVYQAQGKLAEAAKIQRAVLKTFEGIYGQDSPSLRLHLDRLAFVYQAQENYDLALPLAKRSLEIAEMNIGGENQEVVSALISLACIYGNRGDHTGAYILAERALSIAERISGKYHQAGTCLNLMALSRIEERNWPESISLLSELLNRIRWNVPEELTALSVHEALTYVARHFFLFEMLQSVCSEETRLDRENKDFAVLAGAEQSALNKAFIEEFQMTQIAMEYDSRASTHELREQWRGLEFQLDRLDERKLDPVERNARRRELQGELSNLEIKLAERVGLMAQTIRERNVTLTDIARQLPPRSALVDFIQYRRDDFAAKTNQWQEQRYAAYLTFPLARDSTNVVVERVDLGEAAPVNEAVELVCKRMSAGQFAAKGVPPALQRLSQLVYAPLAPYLTNVSHLIVCPDGQLSRLPFEMLPVGNKFLVEEKAISYVTSGREVVRLARRSGVAPDSNLDTANAERARPAGSPSYAGKSLVMGNPDFDLDLRSSRREPALTQSSQPSTNNSQPEGQSQLTLAATRTLSRDYRGLKFNPLPGSGIEATNVAKLLGDDCSLRLGPNARESELKEVQSPRVLHLATHGFFLSDQEMNREIRGIRESSFGFSAGGPAAGSISRGLRGSRFQDWENPLVRCGITLAGANHFTNSFFGKGGSPLPAASSSATNGAHGVTRPTIEDDEDGLLTGLEASLLNLQGTELVILSACDTGTGEVKIGEGVMSLRRAFRIAGAETVLASHWKVSDRATSQLMTELMRRWRAGEPRAKAWREAQLTLLRSKGTKEDFSNPFFWAAFTLTGQWN